MCHCFSLFESTLPIFLRYFQRKDFRIEQEIGYDLKNRINFVKYEKERELTIFLIIKANLLKVYYSNMTVSKILSFDFINAFL